VFDLLIILVRYLRILLTKNKLQMTLDPDFRRFDIPHHLLKMGGGC
jgi:hypothetical protein